MKTYTETVTRRVGEWFPLDPEYEYTNHNGSLYPNNPEEIEIRARRIKEIAQLVTDGKKVRAWYDNDLSGEVLVVGMYDGWPFWKPTPAVLLSHWSGSETYFWYSIRTYQVIKD